MRCLPGWGSGGRARPGRGRSPAPACAPPPTADTRRCSGRQPSRSRSWTGSRARRRSGRRPRARPASRSPPGRPGTRPGPGSAWPRSPAARCAPPPVRPTSVCRCCRRSRSHSMPTPDGSAVALNRSSLWGFGTARAGHGAGMAEASGIDRASSVEDVQAAFRQLGVELRRGSRGRGVVAGARRYPGQRAAARRRGPTRPVWRRPPGRSSCVATRAPASPRKRRPGPAPRRGDGRPASSAG